MTHPTPPHETLTPAPDLQLDRVRRPFDAAFQRMCAATTQDQLEDELSNLLHQLYRLSELCRKRLGRERGGFYGWLHGSNDPDLRAAGAAVWVRTFDTHDVVVVASPADLVSNFFTEMFGVLAWRPLAQLPQQTERYGRHEDYRSLLADHAVLDTSRRAFDAMAGLL